jgi:hypothetical protein
LTDNIASRIMTMHFLPQFRALCCAVLVAVFANIPLAFGEEFSLCVKVADTSGSAIAGAGLKLRVSGVAGQTAANGVFCLKGTVDARWRAKDGRRARTLFIRNGSFFSGRLDGRPFEVYSLQGRPFRAVSADGQNQTRNGSQAAIIRLRADGSEIITKAIVARHVNSIVGAAEQTTHRQKLYKNAGAMAAQDTLEAWADGYNAERFAVAKLNDTIEIVLQDVVCPSKALHPDTTDPTNPLYQVISPNGGELFYVGEECTVTVTSASYGEAVLRLSLGDLVVGETFEIPGKNTSFDPSDTVSFSFTIPASLANPIGQQVSLVSDSCFIRMGDYRTTVPPGYVDQSDCYFRIRDSN